MKKFLLLLSIIATTFLFLGCPSPVLANDEILENNSSTTETKKDEETKSEPIEYEFKPAPQLSALPEGTGIPENFGICLDTEYSGIGDDTEYTIKFNSDGTAEFSQYSDGIFQIGFLHRYCFNTSDKCFYFRPEKIKLDQNGEYLTYNESIEFLKTLLVKEDFIDYILKEADKNEDYKAFVLKTMYIEYLLKEHSELINQDVTEIENDERYIKFVNEVSDEDFCYAYLRNTYFSLSGVSFGESQNVPKSEEIEENLCIPSFTECQKMEISCKDFEVYTLFSYVQKYEYNFTENAFVIKGVSYDGSEIEERDEEIIGFNLSNTPYIPEDPEEPIVNPEEEISSEPIEYNYLPAPPTPVLPEVSGNDGSFPFENGREYEGKDVNDFFYSFKFNEDGTGEIIQRKNSEITNAFLIKYVIDSKNNCFYYYIEKKRILDSTELLTYDECINEIKNNFTEAAYADDILSSINEEESKEIFEQTLVKKYGKNSKEYNEKNTPEYFNIFKGTSEYLNEVIKYFDEELTLQSFLESQISEYEKDIQHTFSSIVKYNYNKNRSNLILENPIGEYSDITFENFFESSEEEISSELIPYNFKPAPQAPTLPNVTFNAADFPFEIGREYEGKKGYKLYEDCVYDENTQEWIPTKERVEKWENSDDYKFTFIDNSTLKYENINKKNGEEKVFKYVIDTEKKCIYCYPEKIYEMGILMTYEECISLLQGLILSEKSYVEQIKMSEDLLMEAYMGYLYLNYGEEYEKNLSEDGYETFLENVTDKELLKYVMFFETEDENITFSEYVTLSIVEMEDYFQKNFSRITKYQYEEIDNNLVITEVLYENTKFEDFINLDNYKFTLKNNNNTLGIESGYIYITIFSGNLGLGEGYSISKLENGLIYTEKNDHLDEEDIAVGFKSKLDPIPYTETGVGENLEVTVTFEGKTETLKFVDSSNDLIVFD